VTQAYTVDDDIQKSQSTDDGAGKASGSGVNRKHTHGDLVLSFLYLNFLKHMHS
jgi:hypothetical protein